MINEWIPIGKAVTRVLEKCAEEYAKHDLHVMGHSHDMLPKLAHSMLIRRETLAQRVVRDPTGDAAE